jgi:hypothetical protein
MAVSANVLRVSTTLRLGERVLVRCDDGLLATENVLFDSTDIVLRATDPVTVRETGYITTARDALARLAKEGVTPELADEAARAIAPEVVVSFARSGALAAIGPELGACELFDGAVYRAATNTYEGAWLDLQGLAAAVQRRGATAVLQALHLAAALSEVAASTPLHLSTASATRDRRPGERTHRRVALDDPSELPKAIRELTSNARRVDLDAQRDRLVRDTLLARVRERITPDAGAQLRAHLARLEKALAEVETRSTGHLADPEFWAIEQQLAAGDARGVAERLADLERARGTSAAIRYLRARAALVGGAEPPSSVAQALSAIANEDGNFHEAELGAARTWLAAGENAYARHFARRLAEDVTARDSERVLALEILDATSATARSQPPPPVQARSTTPAPDRRPPPQSPAATETVHPRAPASDSPAQSLPPYPHETLPADIPIRGPTARGASLPPIATMPPPGEASEGRPVERGAGARIRYDPELVESLALPMGATEEVLAVGDWPTTPIQARTAMTRLARSLARDFRLWYGTTLRCNVLAVDAMQRHLTQRYAGATLEDPKLVSELQRHGALLSEILARSLGGDWVDIAPTEPGYWAMLVPTATRCWPIGRVYRFLALGHSERDLVSYYLDIEARRKA